MTYWTLRVEGFSTTFQGTYNPAFNCYTVSGRQVDWDQHFDSSNKYINITKRKREKNVYKIINHMREPLGPLTYHHWVNLLNRAWAQELSTHLSAVHVSLRTPSCPMCSHIETRVFCSLRRGGGGVVAGQPETVPLVHCCFRVRTFLSSYLKVLIVLKKKTPNGHIVSK